MAIIRVIRVLEYTGEEEVIEKTLAGSGVKGEVRRRGMVIREAILGYSREQAFYTDVERYKDAQVELVEEDVLTDEDHDALMDLVDEYQNS